MPRSSKSKLVRSTASTATVTSSPDITEELTVPTATKTKTDQTDFEDDDVTVRELPFTVNITPAEEGFKPDRSPAGRKRIPSPFEPILPELKGKGWQNQPHDGNVTLDEKGKYNTGDSIKDSNARVIHRELQKAIKFLNSEAGGELNLGLDINITEELVQFNIRDKQKRTKSASDDDSVSSYDDDEDYDSDLDDEDDTTTGDE